MENGKYKITYENKKPIPVAEFLQSIGKFKKMTVEDIDEIQKETDRRYNLLKTMTFA